MPVALRRNDCVLLSPWCAQFAYSGGIMQEIDKALAGKPEEKVRVQSSVLGSFGRAIADC